MDRPSEPLLKGSIMRGYVEFLKKMDRFEAVRSQMLPETRELMDALPLPSEWCASRHTIGIIEAVGAKWGSGAVRQMNRLAVTNKLFAALQPLISGLLKMFGTNPATILRRSATVMRESSRGYSFEMLDETKKACTLQVTTAAPVETEMTAEAWAGAYESVVEVCGTMGKVRVVGVERDANSSLIRLRIEWI